MNGIQIDSATWPEEALPELETKVQETLKEHMRRAANRAQQNHVFQNQTGELEGSIRDLPVVGSFAGGTLETGITADADYTSHVIAKTGDDFLQRALDDGERELELALEEVIASAFNDT